MRNLFIPLLLCIFFSCASGAEETSTVNTDDPKFLIGRWEIIKQYHEGQEFFDLTDKSKKNSNELIEGMKNYFLDFQEDGKVSGGIWINNPNGPVRYKDDGMYKIDERNRVIIQMEKIHKPIPIGGKFRWEIKEDLLYLYPVNQGAETYKVYRRSK